MIVGVGGAGVTLTPTAFDGAVVQPSIVTTTVYDPLAVALYAGEVAPSIGEPSRNHWLPLALLEVSVTLPPSQNDVAPPAVATGVVTVHAVVNVQLTGTCWRSPDALAFPAAETVYVVPWRSG